MRSKLKISNSIVDQFGKPISSGDKLKYKLPNVVTTDGKSASIMTTDSKAYESDLPINDDGFTSNYYQSYSNVNNIITPFAGWGLLSQVSQNPIVRNIIDIKCNIAVLKWGKLIYTGKNGKTQIDKIQMMEQRARELRLKEVFRLAHRKTTLFGGCMVYPKILGDDNLLTKELIVNKNTVKKGSLRYFKVIEPIYIVPTSFQATNPLLKNFYEPEIWIALGNTVHISRLMHFVADEAPVILKPVFQFFGQSLINLLLDYLGVWENMRQEIAEIVGKYNVNVIKTDLSAILSGSPTDNDVDSVKNRIALFNRIRTNFGALAIDKESEEWQQFNMSLNTLDKLLQQNLEYIAAMAQIPATKLFNQSPSGFGSSGELEYKNFHENVAAEQQTIMLPHIERAYELIQYDLFGDYDPNIAFKFNSLDEPSISEKAQAFVSWANGLRVFTGEQPILTTEEAREWLTNQYDMDFTNLDIDANINNLEDIDANINNLEDIDANIKDNPDEI